MDISIRIFVHGLLGLLPSLCLAGATAITTSQPDCDNPNEFKNIRLSIPIEGEAYLDWALSDLVDDNPRQGSFADFRGGQWTYDGNTGTSFGILGFSEMDEGVAVFAAVPGTVTTVRDGEFDRNTCAIPGRPQRTLMLRSTSLPCCVTRCLQNVT